MFKKDSQCIPILFGIQRTCLLCSAKENNSIQVCKYTRVCQKNEYSETLRYMKLNYKIIFAVPLLSYQKMPKLSLLLIDKYFLLKCEQLIHMNWKS